MEYPIVIERDYKLGGFSLRQYKGDINCWQVVNTTTGYRTFAHRRLTDLVKEVIWRMVKDE